MSLAVSSMAVAPLKAMAAVAAPWAASMVAQPEAPNHRQAPSKSGAKNIFGAGRRMFPQ